MEQTSEHLIAELLEVFPAERPLGWPSLVNSEMGFEPGDVADDFADKDCWPDLKPEFLDDSPEGFGSALSFLSDEAVCFYIPAFIAADLRGQLTQVTPAFYLTHGFDDHSHNQKIFSEKTETWEDYRRRRWSHLTPAQAQAIVHYLEWRITTAAYETTDSESQALSRYW